MADRPEAWVWGSYRQYLDPQRAAAWLDWPTVLAALSQRESAARVAYKRFVDAGLDGSLDNPLDAATDGWILGSEAFVERVRKSCLADDGVLGKQTPEQVVELAAQCFGQPTASTLRCGRHANLAREAAILLCRELLAVPAGQIARVFGISPSGFPTAVQRARQRIEAEPAFAARVAELREQLGRGQVV